jgi:hypothetical protein
MADKADQPSADGTGPMARRRTPFRASGARNSQPTRMPIGLNPSAPIPDRLNEEAFVAVVPAMAPDVLPRTIRTQVSYRQLVSSGLTGAEAASLIGYVAGLPSKPSPWTMSQINRMLFLRALYNQSSWGEAERRPAD